MLIGITGSVGAGKSRVAKRLATLLKAKSISTDIVCKELLARGCPGYTEVVDYWGDRFLDRCGNIDRLRLRASVFSDNGVRYRLESILHPLVRAKLQDAKRAVSRTSFIVAEVPLLFESGWQDDFDWIVTVYVPVEVSLVRVAERDGVSAGEVQNILDAQMSPEVKKGCADSVIDNSADWAETEKQLDNLTLYLRQRTRAAS